MAIRLLVTACLFFVLFRDVFTAYRFGHDVLYQQSIEAMPRQDTDMRIPEGQSTGGTTKQLRELGLIRGAWTLRVQSLFLRRKMHTGEYRLNTSETIDEILKLLSTTPEKRGNGKS